MIATSAKYRKCVPGQTHKRQLEHILTLPPYTDVRKEKIHAGATLKVTQIMW